MRTIKFRIYNKKTRKWIHGPNERPDLDGVNLFGETILLGALLHGVSIKDLNEIEACQFTGLYDKNHRQIFEGDILKVSEKDLESGGIHEPFAHVWYSDNGGEWVVSYNHMHSENSASLSHCAHAYEIVGNIFDNPDLIK